VRNTLQSINSYENTLFWPECKAPFYRFISAPDSNPVSDPDSNPDSNPDPKRLFSVPDRIRIQPKVSGSGSATLLKSIKSQLVLSGFRQMGQVEFTCRYEDRQA
jgi:hypothetical protein